MQVTNNYSTADHNVVKILRKISNHIQTSSRSVFWGQWTLIAKTTQLKDQDFIIRNSLSIKTYIDCTLCILIAPSVLLLYTWLRLST